MIDWKPPSSVSRSRVKAARDGHGQRFAAEQVSKLDSRRARIDPSGVVCNVNMRVAEIQQYCKLDGAGDHPLSEDCLLPDRG